MSSFCRRLLALGLFAFLSHAVSAESLADAAARAGLLVESQAAGPEVGIVIGTDASTKERLVAVFRRTDAGAWRIERRDPICDASAAAAPTWSANLATVEASLAAQGQNGPLSIPAGRSLSDGTVRSTQDEVRSWARRMRSDKTPSDIYRKIQKPFEALVSDIGWIDAERFGIRTACDAASIVEGSGSRRLMEGALPIMEKTLKNAEGGEACYARALEAYQKLIQRN